MASTAGVIESVSVEVQDYLTPTSYTTCYDVSWTGVDGLGSSHNIPLPLLRQRTSPYIIPITDTASLKTRRNLAYVHLIVDEGKVRATIFPGESQASYPMPIKQGWRYVGKIAGDGLVLTRTL